MPTTGTSSPTTAIVIMDTTYWGRDHEVMLFKAPPLPREEGLVVVFCKERVQRPLCARRFRTRKDEVRDTGGGI